MGLTDTHSVRNMHKDLLYSTGNYIQYLVITCNGKEYKEKNIDVYPCIAHRHTRHIHHIPRARQAHAYTPVHPG